jgi:hypothetical protein
MIPFEHKALPDIVERVQSGLCAVDARDSDGSVHRGYNALEPEMDK